MIKEVGTGEWIPIEILPVSPSDLRSLDGGWLFSWEQETKKSEVVKLVAVREPSSILGLMSFVRQLGFIDVILLENSPPNVGQGKSFEGIAGSLLAFVANLSVQRGDDGFLRLTAKTELMEHYERRYGFQRSRQPQNMILVPEAATKLITEFLRRSDDGNNA